MSREKSEKDVRNVPITIRLNKEEHEKLKQCAAACGLSAAEFMRQLCKGNAPQPQPKTEFWEEHFSCAAAFFHTCLTLRKENPMSLHLRSGFVFS